jgi:hypothetical protein
MLFFQVRVSDVLPFMSICVLFTDSPSYFQFTVHQLFYLPTLYSLGTERIVK